MSTRDLVLISLFAAIMVALGLMPPISLGFIPVPITAQSLGVMLAGVVLGGKRGTLAVLLVLVLAAIGLPVLAGGRGGLAVFAGPTTGFMIGWVVGAFTTGYLAERLVNAEQPGLVQGVGFFLSAFLGGIIVVYAFGIVYLGLFTGTGIVNALMGSLAFVPGDIVKSVVAALAGRAVMAGYPLLPQRA